MISLTTMGASTSKSSLGLAILTRLLKAVAFLTSLGLLMHWVFPTLLHHPAQSREGYRKRTGFLAGLTVAPISEFSLILCALGLSLGHIGAEALGLITLVGLVTIGLSTYMILFSHALYERLTPWLGVFARSTPYREQAEDALANGARADVIIFGLGRYGNNIAERLSAAGADAVLSPFADAATRAVELLSMGLAASDRRKTMS